MFSGLLGIVIGSGLSIQTVINSRLRGYVGSPFLASTVSFCVGTLSLILIALLSGQGLLISSEQLASVPAWAWIGGFLGVIGLTTNILLFPYLGGVQTAIMPILGQVIMGMLIDSFGWFHAVPQAFGWNRMAGAALVLIGIFCAVALPELRRSHQHQSAVKGIWLWRLLGVVAGMMGATQTAVNGALGRILHSSIQAALISFLVGAITLLLFVAIREGRFNRVAQAAKSGMPWWIWFGGSLGAFFVFGSVILVPLVGTGLTVIFSLLGMIIGSLMVDQFGILGAPRKPIIPVQILGLLLLLAGVGLIRLF